MQNKVTGKLVGTPNWSQLGSEVANHPIKGYKNIMYSLHFYANEKSHSQYLPSKLDESRKKGLASKTRKTGNWKTKDLSKAGEYIRSKYRARKKALGKHS